MAYDGRLLDRDDFMNDHLKGLLITTIGVLFVVPDSLFVRLVGAEPQVTAFWRGLTAGSFILAFLVVTQGFRGFREVLGSGWPGLIYAVLIGTTTPAFVFAVDNTSVANVVFIFAAMPIFAVLFSRIFLGEAIQLQMVVTMAVVFLGLGIIAYGSNTSQLASWRGDIWAVYVCIAFAGALTAARKAKATSMVPALPFAFLGSALILGLFASPAEVFVTRWPLLLAHGACIAAGSCLLAIGPRFISSAEVSLLVLLESVLAPILVWWVLGENPGSLAVLGGTVVISALLITNIYSLSRSTKS